MHRILRLTFRALVSDPRAQEFLAMQKLEVLSQDRGCGGRLTVRVRIAGLADDASLTGYFIYFFPELIASANVEYVLTQ